MNTRIYCLKGNTPRKVQGYEDGYDVVTTVKEISIQPNTSHEWYNGKYMK
jgi:hypothetical protein